MSLSLAGELTFARARELLDGSRSQVSQGQGPMEIDLSGVTRVDSAGLALLLELARAARAAGRELRCTRAPEKLRRLADFFGLTPLLALS
ncbi:MAG TPA: STAS domain-containing protein [Verrucomicrobiae bacterium]|nr:STAS domain-containing protein [Verrucomicrobiae bacterium]